MNIYVSEQPSGNNDEVIVKYCSVDNEILANYLKQQQIISNINTRFISFDINKLSDIYAVVDDKNGVCVDIGHYYETQAKASNAFKTLKISGVKNNLKVDRITVIW